MNWVVLNIKTGRLFYEAVSKQDAEANCPKGYIVKCVDDVEFVNYFNI